MVVSSHSWLMYACTHRPKVFQTLSVITECASATVFCTLSWVLVLCSCQGSEHSLVVLLLQVAFQQADYVAWNLWSSINARPLLPFKYQHLGDMMSLGAAPRCHCYAATLLILALQCICKLPSIIPLVTTLWSCTVLSSLLLHSMSKGFPVEAQRLGPRACCKSALSVPSFLWWFRAREWRCDTPGAGVAPAGEQSSGRSPQFPPGCSRHQVSLSPFPALNTLHLCAKMHVSNCQSALKNSRTLHLVGQQLHKEF